MVASLILRMRKPALIPFPAAPGVPKLASPSVIHLSTGQTRIHMHPRVSPLVVRIVVAHAGLLFAGGVWTDL